MLGTKLFVNNCEIKKNKSLSLLSLPIFSSNETCAQPYN